MSIAFDDLSWCESLEGRDQGPQDAGHWVQVYTSLLKTLSAISMEVPEVRPRVEELRGRLQHWQRVLAERSVQHVPGGELP